MDRNTKDKKWDTVREALKEIEPSDVDQRKKDRVSCWQCGRDNHHTLECFARKDANNKELSQLFSSTERTAAIKKKNSDREEGGAEDLIDNDEAQSKKQKVNAIQRAMETMDVDNSSDSDF